MTKRRKLKYSSGVGGYSSHDTESNIMRDWDNYERGMYGRKRSHRRGWFGNSKGHSLAAKGIRSKTKRKHYNHPQTLPRGWVNPNELRNRGINPNLYTKAQLWKIIEKHESRERYEESGRGQFKKQHLTKHREKLGRDPYPETWDRPKHELAEKWVKQQAMTREEMNELFGPEFARARKAIEHRGPLTPEEENDIAVAIHRIRDLERHPYKYYHEKLRMIASPEPIVYKHRTVDRKMSKREMERRYDEAQDFPSAYGGNKIHVTKGSGATASANVLSPETKKLTSRQLNKMVPTEYFYNRRRKKK